MTILIRPIRYTSMLAAMRDWAIALGMAPLLEADDWLVLAAGRGRLALHRVPDGDPLDGTTTLAVETDDLDALERRWREAGLATRRIDEHGVPLLFGSTPFGGEVAAGELSPSTTESGLDPDLVVMPMLFTRDVPGVADWFGSWGWQRRISSAGGGWIDLELPGAGGLVGIHHADNLESDPPTQPPAGEGTDVREVAVSLTLEHPDVDALLERVRAAGLEDARVHDEAYNRTLITVTPDGDEVWINGEITDLYGYRRG